jgi:RimJ/RimL family protein N-acetyltransferase
MAYRTDRLVLRPARLSDLEPLHEILSDSQAMAFWSSLPHRDLDATREWLEGMIAIPPEEGEDFVVEHRARVIGKAGLYRFPEIGFIFHPHVWGRGFAAEAIGLVLARAFEVHRLERVEADVDPRNLGSLRVLERLGFREVRRAKQTWLIGEQWCDSVYLSIDAEQWRASNRDL